MTASGRTDRGQQRTFKDRVLCDQVTAGNEVTMSTTDRSVSSTNRSVSSTNSVNIRSTV